MSSVEPVPILADAAVADALELLLRAVPGVTGIYPSAPLPAVVVGQLLATHTPIEAPRLVTVASGSGGTRVAALIGIDAGTPAPQTGRLAHESITRYLTEASTLPVEVTVRIVVVA